MTEAEFWRLHSKGKEVKNGGNVLLQLCPDGKHTSGDPVVYGVGDKGLNLLTNRSTRRVIQWAPKILLEIFEELFNMDTVPDNAY